MNEDKPTTIVKSKLFLLPLTTALAICAARGQGTFIYDQSSATNPASVGFGANIQADQPMGQSFIPTLDSVGFVQFNFQDLPTNNLGLGATVFVNLWSGSISNGILLSSTDPIYIPDGAFLLITNFLFSAPVTVTPGATYYLQPYVQSGNTSHLDVNGGLYNYSGGTWYADGAPNINGSGYDLWFREGILAVPEPSSAAPVFIGSGLLFLWHRRKNSVRENQD